MFVISRRLEQRWRSRKALKIVVVVFVMVAMWNYFENELKNMFLFPFIVFSFLMVDILIEFTGL